MYEHSMLPIQQCLKGSLGSVHKFLCLCLASTDHTSPAVKNIELFQTLKLSFVTHLSVYHCRLSKYVESECSTNAMNSTQ